jgi:2-polyprenyl-3-methyl-5-hydroxy-6-metoxy-1,4-benzoquinol methylase
MKVSFKEKSIFEVGGGNGFFLEAALDSGFTVVRGVEPSVAAAEAARQDIRPHIITSIMKRGVLEQNEFDIGVMFHTLDHLSSPVETLRDCVEALKPGGRLIVAIHNERSWSARLLGKRSPIIDVEHTHLYTKKTAELLFRKVGLTEVTSSSYRNHYSLHYIFHLLPFPSSFKLRVLRSSFGKALQRVKVTLPLGNIWISGLKA